jgi:hypothetical protein
MFRVLVLAILVTLAVIVYAKFKKLPPEQQRKNLWRLGTGVFLGVLAVLVITGRMHWVGAAIGALLPFARGAFGLLSHLLPYWLKRKQAAAETATPQPLSTLEEAMEVLGLKGDIKKGEITADMVNDAHRHLIQKLHPDRGGNDYLAAKINQARDLLLAEIQKSA